MKLRLEGGMNEGKKFIERSSLVGAIYSICEEMNIREKKILECYKQLPR
jgi:hypothetical protein